VACWLSGPALPEGAPAVILDASGRGAGLYLSQCPERGRAELQLVGGPAALRAPLRIRVVHRRETSDGGFEVGVEFVPTLTDAELSALLGGS
jgi:hypothetical protein